MSKLNFLVFLQTYSDANSSNNPSLNDVKWSRNISGIPSENPLSDTYDLAPGETKSLFSGVRTLAHDGTTEYSIALKSLTSNTYILSAVAGTLPNFRTPRSTGADASTEVSVTLNGPLATFTSTAGLPFNFASVQVGDSVRIGDLFNQLNQGEFKILAKTSTSFTIENELAAAESSIVLGAGFADQIQIYSAAGVQIGDTLKITGGFSSVTQGSYKITSVAANYLEFYSTDVLPQESNVLTQALAIYSSAKQLVYLESLEKLGITINGLLACELEPFVINNSVQQGVFMLKSTIYSLSVTNNSQNTTKVKLIAAD